MATQKILILGSEGFIGQHLITQAKKQGFDTYGCDLFEYSSQNYNYSKISLLSTDFDTYFSQHLFDIVINAAGSGNVPYSMSQPMSDFENNTQSIIHVLESIRKHNRSCKYLHISSAAVYGNPQELPIPEESKLNPISPYGYHKWMSELICQEYYQIYKIPTAITRPFSVYGPGLKKQLFWELYQKIKNSGKTIELWGTGQETRDFIFIQDLINALYVISQNEQMKGDVYNLASGTETTIKDAVNIFAKAMESNIEIKFNGYVRQGDPANWKANVSKLTALGFKPTVDLKEGLLKTVNWLNKNDK